MVGKVDIFACQFSGAVFHPVCYDYSEKKYAEISNSKEEGKFRSVKKIIEELKPTVYIPSAGPPVFLDDNLFHINFQESNIFPSPLTFRDYLNQNLSGIDICVPVPGTSLVMHEQDIDIAHPVSNPEKLFDMNTLVEYQSSVKNILNERIDSIESYNPELILELLLKELESKLVHFELTHDMEVVLKFSINEIHDKAIYIDFNDLNISIDSEENTMDSDNISAKYGAYEIPYVVIVDKTGNLTYKNNGVASYKTLRSEVNLAISGEGGVAKVAELPTPALAIILGVVTFFSPCSFPLLPGYFSYYFSRNEKNDGSSKLIKALMSGLASASGIMVVFILIALLFIPFSQIVAKYLDELNPIVGTMLLLMGIVMITGYDINWMLDPIRAIWNRITGGRDIASEKSERGGLSGLFFYGFGYGSAAAGCMAPIFLALLAATMKDGLIDAIIVFVLFSISAAVFMVIFTILAAYSKDTVLNLMRGSVGRIEQGGGVVMMIVGIWLLYQYWKVVSVS